MTPHFATAVDPIYLYVLGVLEKAAAGEALDPQDVRERIKNRFREADDRIGQKQGWELAKYALVAWIDDVLISQSWSGREWWEQNALEFEFFKTRDRAIEFFKRSKEAGEMTKRDALEVYYICVVLGFRGLYALNESAFLAQQLDLPPDIETWSRRTARAIQLGQGRPPINESPRPPAAAPPLEGKHMLAGVLAGLLFCSLAFAVACYYFLQQP